MWREAFFRGAPHPPVFRERRDIRAMKKKVVRVEPGGERVFLTEFILTAIG